jgi:VWFA-related protein
MSFCISPLRLLATAALLLPCFPSAAQESKPVAAPQAAPFTLKVTSRLVVLDVVVTDRQGNLRSDLTREHFHVTEDGAPQTILNFEPPSAHVVPSTGAPITSTADLEKRAPQSPVNIIVLDEMNTAFADMAYSRYSLKKYLAAQSQKAMPPTMLIAASYDKVTVLKDYTQDPAAILSALDHHLTAYPWKLETSHSAINMMALSLGVLEQVTQATAGHPGHKNLIWVGKGFGGIDLTSSAYNSNDVAGINGAMQQTVNMLRDSRVTMYTIDPRMLSSTVSKTIDADSIAGGLDSLDASAPDPFADDASFNGLATTSGGKAFRSRNDVDSEIGESVRDGVNYYTIAYRPSNATDTARAYRKIRVTFTMPGLHASYRDGYYAKDSAVPQLPGTRLTYDMAAAEESTLVYTGLKVIAAAKPATPGTYLVGVSEHDLPWVVEGDTESAKLMLVAAALDNKGRILNRATLELTAHRPLQSANPGGLARMEIALPPSPGAYRLRFVVRSMADGHMGTADLQVPGAPHPPKSSR